MDIRPGTPDDVSQRQTKGDAMTDVVSSPLCERKLAPAGSQLVLAEWTAAASSAGEPEYQAPLHVHHEDDEAWYVLEGRLMVRIGDNDYEVSAGAAVVGTHGLPHTFWNPDPVPARYVIVMSSHTSDLLDALHSSGTRNPADLRSLFAAHGCTLLD